MKRCKHIEADGFHHCGSYAFNLEKDGIEQGDLCDVHYWQDQAKKARADERNSWPSEMGAMERQVNILTDALHQERERMKWDVHSCGPTCKRYACVATREAIQAEREACAKVAGWLWQQFQDTKDAHERNSMEPFKWGQFGFDQSTVQQSKRMMDAIRARSNT